MNNTGLGHNNPPSPTELLQEKLGETYEPLLAESRVLINKAKDIANSQIDDDEKCGEFTNLIKEITASIKKLETARTSEKEVFLSGGRVVDSFFKLVTDTLDKTKRAINQPVTDYLNEKQRKERLRLAAEAEERRKQAEAQLQAAAELEGAGLDQQAAGSLSKAEANTDKALKLDAAAAGKPSELSHTRGTASVASLRTRWVGKIIDYNTLDLEMLRSFIPQDALQKALNGYVAAGNRHLVGAAIYEESTAAVR
jgi:dihydrofolate reductase